MVCHEGRVQLLFKNKESDGTEEEGESGRKTYANKAFRFNINEHTNCLGRGDCVALHL
jgi:hypothetical protein